MQRNVYNSHDETIRIIAICNTCAVGLRFSVVAHIRMVVLIVDIRLTIIVCDWRKQIHILIQWKCFLSKQTRLPSIVSSSIVQHLHSRLLLVVSISRGNGTSACLPRCDIAIFVVVLEKNIIVNVAVVGCLYVMPLLGGFLIDNAILVVGIDVVVDLFDVVIGFEDLKQIGPAPRRPIAEFHVFFQEQWIQQRRVGFRGDHRRNIDVEL
mmetsp:Transcript_18830/g.29917  ORF Transcript_18830/g.29917 Transcript_18830/m.29917 type:complete len:209 (-) Transcript_18830:1028-1654(-)